MRHSAQQRFDSCFQSIAKMREWPEGCCLVSNLLTLGVKSLHQDDVCRVAASPAEKNDERACPALTCSGEIMAATCLRSSRCDARSPAISAPASSSRPIVFDKL